MEYKEMSAADEVILSSPYMKQIYEKADLLANSQVAVLIYGESGVGKTFLAEYIQKRGPKTPFVCIHCNAISSELFASELFGYSPNAFTGASPRGKMGLLEAADHGTVLFDEINELSGENQTLLLHFLQNKTITPIGSLKSRSIHTRIICTSGCSLLKMIQENSFRADLYYRICAANLYIPPMRQRREEIPLFLRHFIRRFSRELDLPGKAPALPQEKLNRLCSLEWRGNIREIENLAQTICLSDDVSQVIDSYIQQNLNAFSFPSESYIQHSPVVQNCQALPIKPLKEALNEFEQAYIQRVLNETSTLQEAAHVLNISVSTLCRKKAAFKDIP